MTPFFQNCLLAAGDDGGGLAPLVFFGIILVGRAIKAALERKAGGTRPPPTPTSTGESDPTEPLRRFLEDLRRQANGAPPVASAPPPQSLSPRTQGAAPSLSPRTQSAAPAMRPAAPPPVRREAPRKTPSPARPLVRPPAPPVRVQATAAPRPAARAKPAPTAAAFAPTTPRSQPSSMAVAKVQIRPPSAAFARLKPLWGSQVHMQDAVLIREILGPPLALRRVGQDGAAAAPH